MGMAASQARFLGLTARKSNTEYQAQQINQQRTALSNESANLYNQMMDLTVPTPPSSSDYYTTQYTLDDSAYGTQSDYVIKGTPVKNSDGSYQVTLETSKTVTEGVLASPKVTSISREVPTGKSNQYIYTLVAGGSKIVYNSYLDTDLGNVLSDSDWTTVENKGQTNALSPYYRQDSGSKDTEGNTIYKYSQKDLTDYQLYKIDPSVQSDTTNGSQIAGYSDAVTALKEATKDSQGNVDETIGTNENPVYFYQDTKGKKYFITQSQLLGEKGDDGQYHNGILDQTYTDAGSSQVANGLNQYMQTSYQHDKTETTSVSVQATVETTNKDRYSQIQVYANDDYPTELSGKVFSLTCASVFDQNSYDDAYNDYEYEKELYEQKVDNINSQTEILQKQDQNLELRIDQLDTEQNAIQTEVDSVKKVIEDNVEKTFNIFA